MTVKSFLMILNKTIPAVGKASYGRDFYLNKKAVKTLVVSKIKP